jgi:hypothetical protein
MHIIYFGFSQEIYLVFLSTFTVLSGQKIRRYPSCLYSIAVCFPYNIVIVFSLARQSSIGYHHRETKPEILGFDHFYEQCNHKQIM